MVAEEDEFKEFWAERRGPEEPTSEALQTEETPPNMVISPNGDLVVNINIPNASVLVDAINRNQAPQPTQAPLSSTMTELLARVHALNAEIQRYIDEHDLDLTHVGQLREGERLLRETAHQLNPTPGPDIYWHFRIQAKEGFESDIGNFFQLNLTSRDELTRNPFTEGPPGDISWRVPEELFNRVRVNQAVIVTLTMTHMT